MELNCGGAATCNQLAVLYSICRVAKATLLNLPVTSGLLAVLWKSAVDRLAEAGFVNPMLPHLAGSCPHQADHDASYRGKRLYSAVTHLNRFPHLGSDTVMGRERNPFPKQ
jgi:hypothetical protein